MQTAFAGKVRSFQPSEKGADVEFVDCTADDVVAVAEQFLASVGLSLERGTTAEGIYGSGSRAARAIGGGVIKRRKYAVGISIGDGGVRLSMQSAMSGIGGSLIGVIRERRQRKKFVANLRSYLGWQD